MPIISKFFGITIFMHWKDHSPPHFHARYGDDEILVEIESGKVIGSMSKRAINLIHDWRKLHLSELMNDWKRAQAKEALFAIRPLE